jgi:hypothetical protein
MLPQLIKRLEELVGVDENLNIPSGKPTLLIAEYQN